MPTGLSARRNARRRETRRRLRHRRTTPLKQPRNRRQASQPPSSPLLRPEISPDIAAARIRALKAKLAPAANIVDRTREVVAAVQAVLDHLVPGPARARLRPILRDKPHQAAPRTPMHRARAQPAYVQVAEARARLPAPDPAAANNVARARSFMCSVRIRSST